MIHSKYVHARASAHYPCLVASFLSGQYHVPASNVVQLRYGHFDTIVDVRVVYGIAAFVEQ